MAMQKKGGMEDRDKRGGNKPSADRDPSANRGGNRSDLDKDRGGKRSDPGDDRNANRDRIPSDQEDRDHR